MESNAVIPKNEAGGGAQATAVVTGFLGAGKTTFLRRVLPLLRERGLTPSVVINDYQNARVDADTLRELAAEVSAIEGSCVCCESVGELMRTLLELPSGGGRVVLIEANGTTDPCALIDHVTVNAVLRERFRPLVQVTAANARRWQRRFWHNELERLQVRTASHIAITHGESEKPGRVEEVRSGLAELAPRAVFVTPESFAEIFADLAAGDQRECRGESCCCGHSHGHGHCGHHHGENERGPGEEEHHAEHVRLSHGFLSAQIGLPDSVDRGRLLAWLESLPPEVLRAKGVVGLDDTPGRHFVFQKTDETKWGPTVFELNSPPSVSPCAVIVGVKLDADALARSLEKCLNNPQSSNQP